LKVKDKDEQAAAEVLNGAISRMMEKEGLITELSFDAMDEFKGLFASRFGPGRQAMGKWASQYKAMGSLEALGNFGSTLTQIGDITNAIHFNGLGNTVKTMVDQMFGKSRLDAELMGLVHTVDVSTSSVGHKGVARLLDMERNLKLTLKATGISKLDGQAQNNLLNGALRKAEGQVKNLAGENAVRKRWGAAFGDQTEDLIADLKAGKVTENTKLLAFNTLSDAQPVSLSEMPQKYLDSPNGRIFYTLKTFAVNQLNVIGNIIRDPNVPDKTRVQAGKEMAAFLGYYGLINGTVAELKDLAGNQGFNIEDMPDNVIDAWLGLGFINRYGVDNYGAEGDIMGFVANAISPVIPATFNAGVNQFPVVGKTVDAWFMGGGEKRERRDKQGKLLGTGFGGNTTDAGGFNGSFGGGGF